jgi:hypothetical protein
MTSPADPAPPAAAATPPAPPPPPSTDSLAVPATAPPAAPPATDTPAVPATDAPGDRPQPKNPLHGITLEQIVTELQAHYGWEELGQQVRINCFISDPSVTSSLKFLRRTPWARAKVESLYLFMLRERRRQGK